MTTFDQFSPITREERREHRAVSYLNDALVALLSAETALLEEGRTVLQQRAEHLESILIDLLREYRTRIHHEALAAQTARVREVLER